MPVKQHLKVALHLVYGEGPLMERRQDGQQHIGIVLDLVQIVVILVIVVGLLIGVQILPQFILHCTIGGLCRQQVRILGEIGGRNNVGHTSAEDRGTGLQQPQQHDQQQTDPADDKERLFVPGYELAGLLRRLRAFLCALGCRLRRRLCTLRAARRPVGRRVLPLHTLLLPDAGDGAAGCKLGVIMERLLVKRLRVGPDRRLLRLCRVPPGLHLPLRPPVLQLAVPIAHGFFHAALGEMARGHAGVLLLHLPHLGVGGVADLLQRPRQRIHRLMERGLLFGNGGSCRVQLIRRLVGFADRLLQLRRGAFLV